MDTADPPGLAETPMGEKANQMKQSEMVGSVKVVEGSKVLESGEKGQTEEKVAHEQKQTEVRESSNQTEDTGLDKVKDKGTDNLTGGSRNGDSWVEVTQEKKVMKKYEVTITEKEGKKNVEIPDDIIEKGNLLWEDFLIGMFLDTAPHVARVHAIVNKIWSQGEQKQIDVHIVDDTTMKFRVTNPVMRARILRRGMWNIGNVPLVVTKWTPEELKEKAEIKSIPMWVYLKNVPMNMFSWQGLSFIASAAGFLVRLHPETASFSNFKLAKIFVNVDLSKEQPDKINFTKNGKSSLVEFIYPRLPHRCHTCGKWGHIAAVCVMNKKNKGSEDDKKNVEEGKKDERKEPINETKEEVMGEAVEDVEEGEMVGNWSDVTPGKASKSSNTLKFGQVKLLTPSRFSALLEIDETGDMIKSKEMEENSNIEEANTKVGEKSKEKAKEVSEENKDEEEMGEINEKEIVSVGNQKQDIAGLNSESVEHWPDLASATRIRPSLPRRSKALHKVIPEKPGQLGKRNPTHISQ